MARDKLLKLECVVPRTYKPTLLPCRVTTAYKFLMQSMKEQKTYMQYEVVCGRYD